MKFCSSTYNVGYPVYGAKFLNSGMLLVAGGGGEGNNGIPNKLTVLRVDFEKKKVVKRFREITLDPNDDSPTTLDVANDIILMGCNENTEKIKSGEGNQHLRKFIYENEHLRFVASIDFDGSKTPEDYTKLVYLSKDGTVGAIASSQLPTIIRIIDPRNLTEKYEIETGHDVKDMHFAPDGKVISYITATTLEVISIVTGRFIIRKTDFDKNFILSKLRFLTDNTIVIAASLKKGSGIVLIKISLKSGTATVFKSKMVTNKFKGVTSMDVDAKNQLAVLAGNENSIALVRLNDLSLGKMFKQVHNFAITRVTFSPDSQLIASVSAANTVNVIKIPSRFALSVSVWKQLWRFFINSILIVLLGIFGHYFYKYDMHKKSFGFLKEKYAARKNQNSIANDLFEQTTLVGDFLSTPFVQTHAVTATGSISSSVVEPLHSSSIGPPSSNQVISETTTSAKLFSTTESVSAAYIASLDSDAFEKESVTSHDNTKSAYSHETLEEVSYRSPILSNPSFTGSNPLPSTASISIFRSTGAETPSSISGESMIIDEPRNYATAGSFDESFTSSYESFTSSYETGISTTRSNDGSFLHSTFSPTSLIAVHENLSTISSSDKIAEESISDSVQFTNVGEETQASSFLTQDEKEPLHISTTLIDHEHSPTELASASAMNELVSSSNTVNHNTEGSSLYADAENTAIAETASVQETSQPYTDDSSYGSKTAVVSAYTPSRIQETAARVANSELKEVPINEDATKSQLSFTSSALSVFPETDSSFVPFAESMRPGSTESLAIQQAAMSMDMSISVASQIASINSVGTNAPHVIDVKVSISQSSEGNSQDSAEIRISPSSDISKSQISKTREGALSYMTTPTEGILSKRPETEETIPEELLPPETGTQETAQHIREAQNDLSISDSVNLATTENIEKISNMSDNNDTADVGEFIVTSSLGSTEVMLDSTKEMLSKENLQGAAIVQKSVSAFAPVSTGSLYSTPSMAIPWSEQTDLEIDSPEEIPTLKMAQATGENTIDDEL